MKTLKNSISVMLLAVGMFLSFSVMAQPQRQGGKKQCQSERFHERGGVKHGKAMFGQRLGLTDDQKEQAKEIHLASAKEMKPFVDKLRELKAHHQTLETAEVANIKAINKSIDEMSKVHASIAKVKAKYKQEFRSLLTEEQRVKMEAMKKHRGEKKHHGMRQRPQRRG